MSTTVRRTERHAREEARRARLIAERRRERRGNLTLGSLFGILMLSGVALLISVVAIIAACAVLLWQAVL